MKASILLFLISSCLYVRGQINIEYINNNCPESDILRVCLNHTNEYSGTYNYVNSNNFCGETYSGTVTVYQNNEGEYLLDDFSFGSWQACYNIDPPTGTLRFRVECNEFLGISGTDNYGDVWNSNNIVYSGSTITFTWFNTYGEFATVEITPSDGRVISEPNTILESEYAFLWNTGETSQTISTIATGVFSVTVSHPSEVDQISSIVLVADGTSFDLECNGEILEVRYFLDHNENGLQDFDEITLLVGSQYLELSPKEKYFAYEERHKERYVLEAQTYDLDFVNPNFVPTNMPDKLTIEENEGLVPLSIGLKVINNINSAEVDLGSASFPRCNSVIPVSILVKNTGTTVFTDTVKIVFDPVIDFISSSIVPVLQEEGMVAWRVVDLDVTKEYEIFAYLRLPAVDFVGDVFCINSEFGNNYKSNNGFCFELRCAYDPNDKHGNPYRGDKNFTLFEEEMNYIIRFENLGNDTAFNVRVEDQLDLGFDLESFRFIQASHDVTRHYIKEDRTIVFEFKNIELPSIEQDSIANKGFVQFGISVNPGLEEAYEIENKAGIFFDLNAPVITNTTLHTFVSELPFTNALNDIDHEILAFSLYPNPVKDNIHIQCDELHTNIVSLKILDASGRCLIEKKSYRSVVDVSEFSTGLYFIELTSSDNRRAVKKFIKI